MKKVLGISVLIFCWLISSQTTFSQDSEDVKSKTIQKEVKVTIDKDSSEPLYTVETTTTENGKKQVEKKTYSSLEEMKADSSLEVFNTADKEGNITMKLSDKGSGVMVFTSEEGETVDIKIDEISEDIEWVQVGDEEGHKKIKKTYHVIKEKAAFSTASIEPIVSGDPDFSSFNLSGMPELALKSMNYYPNPNEGEFTLTFTGSKKPVIVRILDIKGNLKMEENIEDFNGTFNQVLNVKHFNKGSYLLQIFQQDKVLNRKLILE